MVATGDRVATSIGGTLTGRGADIIIIDDPLKAEDAHSDVARKKVIDWYTGTLTTRLNDKRTGCIIMVMQRLHEEDLAGYVINTGDSWRHMDLPAIALADQDIPIGPDRTYNRKEGDALQPEREPLDVLEKIRADIGALKFSAQYQQRPIPLEGNIVKRKWLGYFDAAPEGKGVHIVQSWDTASTTSENNDYSACVTAAIYKKQYYLLNVWRGRLAYPELKRKIVSHASHWRPRTLLIEDTASGKHLVQELRAEVRSSCPRPIGITPQGDKAVRMEAASSIFERGEVFLPRDTSWLGVFLDELLAFPKAHHDDQVDALSQLLNWAQKNRKPRIGTYGGEFFTSYE